MTWFKKEEESKIPEKFRKMSAEDIAKVLEGTDTAVAEVTKLRTELEAKNTELTNTTNQFTQTQEKLRQLEGNRRQDPPPDPNANKAPTFLEDPQGYVDHQIRQSFTPVALATLQTNAQMSRESAKRTLDRQRVQGTKISKGAMFDKYSSEIDDLAKKTNIQSLQTPDAWMYLFNSVLGTHLEEIVAAYSAGKGDEMFVEGAASNITNNHDTPQPDKPTPEEIQIAQRMKIPIEQYMKNKKEMVFA